MIATGKSINGVGQVTCIKWNPRYNDLCAVGFGSYAAWLDS